MCELARCLRRVISYAVDCAWFAKDAVVAGDEEMAATIETTASKAFAVAAPAFAAGGRVAQ